MPVWPKNPRIYEINALVWVRELSSRYGQEITLATVPRQEWNSLAGHHMDAVWLMGVWERSPFGRDIALGHEGLREEYTHTLSDFNQNDVLGSPYCVRSYEVDSRLGGARGLAAARKELAKRGMLLILDYVPNHVAIDHPWVKGHPEIFVRGTRQDMSEEPSLFTELGNGIFALGRDPYFPAWTDVLQLNAFHQGMRKMAIRTLKEIATQCDGVRCDMAMLLINDVFERTWGDHAGAPPDDDFWEEVIPAVRKEHPEVLFMAEAYWDLEWTLMQQGFNCCYDKRLYDRLVRGSADGVRLHLSADVEYQERLVRFIENHDEPRAAAAFGEERARAAAVAMTTLPGTRLYHEGQLEGRRVKLPVQLGRGPREEVDPATSEFYRRLLECTRGELMSRGRWLLCDVEGWPDNASCRNILAWCWKRGHGRTLVAVNLSDRQSQGMVKLPWPDLAGRSWKLTDLMGGSSFENEGDEIAANGLYVDLSPWGYHVLAFGDGPE
jgi:hypothetical protein